MLAFYTDTAYSIRFDWQHYSTVTWRYFSAVYKIINANIAGTKGDKGEPGEKGKRGLIGFIGYKGEQGNVLSTSTMLKSLSILHDANFMMYSVFQLQSHNRAIIFPWSSSLQIYRTLSIPLSSSHIFFRYISDLCKLSIVIFRKSFMLYRLDRL